MMAFPAFIAGMLALASTGGAAASPSQSALLKDWAVARCLARGASGSFAQDAARSAAALLERSTYGIETFEAIEALVGRTLARRANGSVRGSYVTLQCIDLSHDPALDRLIAHWKPTPV